jgi:hypothetical protein
MNINLHIERLVLDGIEIESRHRGDLLGAIESELRSRVGSGGVSSWIVSGDSRGALRGGAVVFDNNRGADVFGQQIGRAIASTIQR